jgi:hypothetical protein
MRAFLIVLLSLALGFAGAPARAEDDPKPPPKPDAPPKPDPAKEEARGRIGFAVAPSVLVPPEVARNLGMLPMSAVVVYMLVRHGPAEQAGLRVGDVLVKVNGKEMPATGEIDLENLTDARNKFNDAFIKLVEDVKPGDEVTLLLKRQGEEMTVKAKAVSQAAMKRIEKGLPPEEETKPSAPAEPAADQGAVGFEALPLGSVTEKQREDWHVKAASGVVVSRVVKGSPAEAAGLKLGDALLKYGGVEMPTGEDLADAGKGAKTLVRDTIAKIEADLKVDGEIEILVRRDFKPWKFKAKAVTQAALKALIDAEGGGGKKEGEKPVDPPKEKPPEVPPKEKPPEDPPK